MPNRFTIIDGYNVLHSAGIISRGIGPGTLARARQRLIGHLARALSDSERRRTTLVFDAKSFTGDDSASRSSPEEITHGIDVRFAREVDEADDLIEELIRCHPAPKQLTVVSSDRRLMTAARRRRARAIDSAAWFEQLQEIAASSPPPPAPHESPKHQSVSEAERTRWLELFQASENPENTDHPFPPGYVDDIVDELDLQQDSDDDPGDSDRSPPNRSPDH